MLGDCSRQAPPPYPQTLLSPVNRLLFAGDVMFSRAVRREMLAAHDAAFPFRKIACTLKQADIAFVNLESPFSDRGRYFEDGLIFHSAPGAIAGLELAGIGIVSTANNHSRDCGPYGVAFTVGWLRAHHIEALGSSESEAATHRGVILDRKGVRFGFLGYTFDQQNGNWRDVDARIALADPIRMAQDVAVLRRRCEVVIVSMHHGAEYQTRPNLAQIAFAHAAIDAGATLVIGHHPHVVQRTERYRGGWVVYSLGNFVFDQFQRQATQHGELAEITFWGTRVLDIEAIPVRITTTGPELE